MFKLNLVCHLHSLLKDLPSQFLAFCVPTFFTIKNYAVCVWSKSNKVFHQLENISPPQAGQVYHSTLKSKLFGITSEKASLFSLLPSLSSIPLHNIKKRHPFSPSLSSVPFSLFAHITKPTLNKNKCNLIQHQTLEGPTVISRQNLETLKALQPRIAPQYFLLELHTHALPDACMCINKVCINELPRPLFLVALGKGSPQKSSISHQVVCGVGGSSWSYFVSFAWSISIFIYRWLSLTV